MIHRDIRHILKQVYLSYWDDRVFLEMCFLEMSLVERIGLYSPGGEYRDECSQHNKCVVLGASQGVKDQVI